MSQIYVLGTGKGLRIRFSVLDLLLGLGPISQVYVLRTGKCPRIRFYVLDLIVDLGSTFRKISYIQFLGPRTRSQVLENMLDLGSRSQIQFLGPRKCLRFWSSFLCLCTRYWRRYQNQVLGPRKGPSLVPKFQEMYQILGPRSQNLGPRGLRSQIQVPGPRKVLVIDLGPMSQVLGSGKVPRIRFLLSQKRSQIQVSSRSQIQVYYSYIFVLRPSKPP